MTWLTNLMAFFSDRLFNTRSFFYHREELAFERRREQIRRNAYFTCRDFRN